MGGAVFPPRWFDLRPNYGGGDEHTTEWLNWTFLIYQFYYLPFPEDLVIYQQGWRVQETNNYS